MDTVQSDAIATQRQPRKERPTAAGLGITTDKPKYPEYAQVSKRSESFRDSDDGTSESWPADSPVTIDALVEAGLVYTGVGDSVRCYHCGGGLRNWEVDDDPMIEHAKWYPTCPHIILLKGKNYVEKAGRGEVPEEDGLATFCKSDKPGDVFDSPAAQATMQMGYSEDLVKKAIFVFKYRKGLEKATTITYTARDLCEIVLDLETNPDLYLECFNNDASKKDNDGLTSDGEEDEEAIKAIFDENERLKEMYTCKICLDKRADVIFLPCGHMVSCAMCAPAMNKCPMCRRGVNGLIKAHYVTLKECED